MTRNFLSLIAAVGSAAVALGTVGAAPAAAGPMFRALLTGDQEVPPVNSPFTGSATLELFDLGGGDFSLSYELSLPAGLDYSFLEAGTPGGEIPDTNMTAVRALHIHNAERGANGPIVYGIFNPDQDFDDDVVVQINADGSASVTGSWGPSDGNPVGNINDFASDLLAVQPGRNVPLYFNLHTVREPAGEIRGQIVAVAEPAALTITLLGLAGVALTSRRAART